MQFKSKQLKIKNCFFSIVFFFFNNCRTDITKYVVDWIQLFELTHLLVGKHSYTFLKMCASQIKDKMSRRGSIVASKKPTNQLDSPYQDLIR